MSSFFFFFLTFCFLFENIFVLFLELSPLQIIGF